MLYAAQVNFMWKDSSFYFWNLASIEYVLHMHACAPWHVQWSEDNFVESVLFFYLSYTFIWVQVAKSSHQACEASQ